MEPQHSDAAKVLKRARTQPIVEIEKEEKKNQEILSVQQEIQSDQQVDLQDNIPQHEETKEPEEIVKDQNNGDQAGKVTEQNLDIKDLIFGSHLLRSAFSLDVFKGQTKQISEDKPLFSLKNQDLAKTADTNTLDIKGITIPKDFEEKETPDTASQYKQRRQRSVEIVEMIQRNKNNFYFNMIMDKEKPNNALHPYMTLKGKKDSQPFAYTRIKVPNMNEGTDLVPLTPNKKFAAEDVDTEAQLAKEYNTMRRDFTARKNKISSLITERNDREYYLSINTNPFKVKMAHLKKMNKAVNEEINKKIVEK